MTGAQAYSKRPRARNCRGEAASSRAEAGGEVFSVGQSQARCGRREAAGRGTAKGSQGLPACGHASEP